MWEEHKSVFACVKPLDQVAQNVWLSFAEDATEQFPYS